MVQKKIFWNKLSRLKGKVKNIETSIYQKKNKQRNSREKGFDALEKRIFCILHPKIPEVTQTWFTYK